MARVIYRCYECDTTFDEEEAARAVELEDDMYDRPPSPHIVLICPHCGSMTIDEDGGE